MSLQKGKYTTIPSNVQPQVQQQQRGLQTVSQRGPTPPQTRPEEYSQSPRSVPFTAAPSFYRQSRPVPTNSVPQRNINTVTISTSNPPIFGQPLSGMFLSGVSLQPPLFLQQSNQHTLQYARAPYNQNQYQLTASQQQFMPSANTYFQPPPNAGVYFPQAPTPMPVAQNRQTSVQLPSSGQTPPPKKEKKIIPICDPVSGRDVTKEILNRVSSSSSTSPPQSTPISSARATPPASSVNPPTNFIAAQFAAQVAATLSTDSPKPLRSTSPNSQELGSTEKTDASNDIKYNSSIGSTTEIKIEPKETVKTEKLYIKETIDSGEPTIIDKLIDKPQDNIDPSQTLNILVNLVSEEVKPDIISKSEEVDIKVESKLDVNMEKNTGKKDRTDNSNKVDKDTRPEVKSEVGKENNNVKQDIIPLLVQHISVKTDTPVILNGESIALDTTTKIKVEEQVLISKENGELDVAVNSSAIVAEYENEAKESKRVKGKKKMKEINRRGETKEGTDMDAFTDREEGQLLEDITKNTECLQDPSEDALALKNDRNESRAMSVDSDRSSSDDGRKDKQELKLKYKDDQWSPFNTEGKRHYDRTFLLQMQFQPHCLEKPDGLPKLEVVRDSANKPRTDGRIIPNIHTVRQFSNTPDFTPGYVKSSPRPQGGGGGGGGMGRRTSQQGKARETRKIIHNVSLNSDVKLHETENAWRPGHLSKNEKEPEELSEKESLDRAEVEDLHRKVRGILNKLTPQKFDTLLEQVNTLKIDTEHRLKGVIDLVFDKAVDEPSFSFAYASLCKCLGTLKVPVEGGAENQCVNFRKILLNRCQKEFEKDISEELAQNNLYKALEETDSEEKKKQISDEIEELEMKVKRRSIGNIRFIGELFKLKMLTEKIMHECLIKLLRQNDEDSFECLCRLLTTIGADIDHDKNKIEQYFLQMRRIADEKKISSRVRFMILDVIDLRKTGWKPRRDENNPKTIDQIHREAEQEIREQQFALQQMTSQPHPKRTDERRRGGRGGGGGNGGMGQTDEGWNTVASKSNRPYDPAKLKLTKQTVDDSIQLGPGIHVVAGWIKGSSGGTKVSSQEKDTKPSMPANRFSALGEQSAIASDTRNNRSGPPSRDSSKGRGSTQLPQTQRGKPPSNRDNRDREKEQAIAAVKTITGASSIHRHSNSRDRSASREYSKESEKESEKVVSLAKEVHKLSEGDMEKKTKTILDEYLHINDYAEALQCVTELSTSGIMHIFVSTSINHVLERSVQARHSIGSLLHDLVKRDIFSLDVYLQGLKSVLEFADDMSIDIPHIWTYLGELIGPMVQDHSLPLSFLKEIVQPVMSSGKAGLLIAEILHSASNNMSAQTIGELWKSSGLQWSDFLSHSEDVQQFIEDNNLKFCEVHSDSALSIEAIRDKLKFLIAQNNSENEAVFSWIEANVGEPRTKEPQFIRAVVAAVCESAIKGAQTTAEIEVQQFKLRTNLFERYLDHNETLELQALYELQAVIHRLDHPPGMLRLIFDTLYDEDIISEDAFNSWETSKDPNEQEGKGVALKSLVQFYTWLREADEESD